MHLFYPRPPPPSPPLGFFYPRPPPPSPQPPAQPPSPPHATLPRRTNEDYPDLIRSNQHYADLIIFGATADASVAPGGGALLCRTPGWATNATQTTTLELSLNAQQYTADGLLFHFFEPPQPGYLYPLSGPSAGDTQLLLKGEGFHDFYEGDFRCRIGNLLTPTTRLSFDRLACATPPLDELSGSGALGSLFTAFLAPPNGSVVLGDAAVHDGALKLTTAKRWQTGSFVMRPDGHLSPLRTFDTNFEVLIGGGRVETEKMETDEALFDMLNRGHEPLSGEGVCFAFGDIAQGLDLNSVRLQQELQFGEHGPRNVSTAAAAASVDGATFGVAADGTTRVEPTWRGLVVSLLTYTSRELQVKWDGELLFSVHLGGKLRKMGWARMRVAMNATGLSLWYDDVRYLTDTPLPGWAPTRMWAWGFGASTSRATDHHWIDNFKMTSAWLAAAPVSYPVHITLNRQEYYDTNQTFTYRRPPVLSSVLPASGQRAGGTRVVLSGTNLDRGTHYKCRFGGVPPGIVPPLGSEPLEQFMSDAVHLGPDTAADAALTPLPFGATFGASSVACFAPNTSEVPDAVVALELSVNGQDYTSNGLAFARHAPGVDRIYPTSGPHIGFAVVLSGADLSNGTAYRCRFQAPHLASGCLQSCDQGACCRSHPSEAEEGRQPRAAADCVQRYGAGNNPCASDERAVVGASFDAHASLPAAPPPSPAPSEVVACMVPRLRAVPHNVSVSLNAQQFTPSGWVAALQGEVALQLYPEPLPTSLSPSAGPTDGGTAVLVAGINLTQASNTTCRFASMEESPLATALVATSPGTLLPLERMPHGTPSSSLGRAGYDGTSYDGAAWDAIAAIAPCHEPSTGAHSASAAGPGGGACPVPQDGPGVVVRCFSPTASLHTCGAASTRCVDKANVSAVLELAMNGQDHTDAGFVFTSYRVPTLLALSPNTGPSAGATLVRLVAEWPMHSGVDYRCGFGTPGNRTVPATYDPHSGDVLCHTPALPSPANTGTSSLRVTLNGQQYHVPLPFGHYGAPSLSSFSPSCGPAAGGTLVTIGGTQLANGSHYVCRFVPAVAGAAAAAAYIAAPAGYAELLTADGRSGTCLDEGRWVPMHFRLLDYLTDDAGETMAEPDRVALCAARCEALAWCLAFATEQRWCQLVTDHGSYLHMDFDALGVPFNFSVAVRAVDELPTSPRTAPHPPPPRVFNGARYALAFSRPYDLPDTDEGAARSSLKASVFGRGDVAAQPDARCFVRQAYHRKHVLGERRVPAAHNATAEWVTCTLPAGEAEQLTLEVSLNGQQFTADGRAFSRHAILPITGISPASGPVHGETTVKVAHVPVALPACDTRCRFEGSGHVVNGTLEADGMVCVSPAGVATGPLELSLNGQQFSVGRFVFEAYVAPTLSQLLPPLGPAGGATALLVTANNMVGGSDVRCRFAAVCGDHCAAAHLAAGDARGVAVPHNGSFALSCTTPACVPPDCVVGAAADGNLGMPDNVTVTLNGQQFSEALPFVFLPPTDVVTVYPASGPALGGSSVTMHGDGFAAHAQDPLLLRCRIGETWTPATYLNGSAVRCVSPPGDVAGTHATAALDLSAEVLQWNLSAVQWRKPTCDLEPGMCVPLGDANFVPLLPLDGSLRGDARVEHSEIVLTRLVPFAVGSVTFGTPPLASDPQQLQPLGAFRLTFTVTIGTGADPDDLAGGEGFSLSFGDLPASGTFGENGGGAGLRVSLLTRRGRLVASYRSTELFSTVLPPANLSRLRSNSSVRVELRYRAAGLTLRLDGTTHLRDSPIPGWAPRPHWRFGLGARNHHSFDNHFVRDVQFERGALLDAAVVPLEVSANGQQFSPPGPPGYTYYGVPVLSSVSPALGPTHGGTAVTVYGANLFGGSAYRCCFGGQLRCSGGHATPASFAADESVRCTSPTRAEVVADAGEQVWPSTHPHDIGHWHAAEDMTPAHGRLTAADAAEVGAGGAVAIELSISLNEQDYLRPSLNWTHHPHLHILATSPHAGPVRGNTTVLLAVRGLEHLPNVSGAVPECRFGEGMGQAVPGTLLPPSAALAQCAELASECNASGVWAAGLALQYPGGARSWAASARYVPGLGVPNASNAWLLSCLAPPHAAGFVGLYVALNTADFRLSGSTNFSYHEPAAFSPPALSPATGPRDGGTLVRLLGAGMAPVGALPGPALCRFGAFEVVASVVGGEEVRCTSPTAREALAARSVAGFEAPSGVLSGRARVDAQGVLRLSEGAKSDDTYTDGGAYVLPQPDSWRWPLLYFDVTFETLLDDMHGMAFSVGHVPLVGLGADGGGRALVVAFAPPAGAEGAARLLVTHRSMPLVEVPLKDVLCRRDARRGIETADDVVILMPRVTCRDLKAGVWRAVRVAWLEDGLHVSLDGAPLVGGVEAGGYHVADYRPQPGWRLALSAHGGFPPGRKWVRGLTLLADADVHGRALPVHLSLNGQQFDPTGVDFTHYAHPTPLRLLPRSGPLRGGTLVTVTALNLANGSHSHRCRFGDAGWVPGTLAELGTAADRDGPRGAARTTLRCVTPLASELPGGAVNLSLSLERDGQTLHTYATHTLPFELYNDSVIAAVDPASGPIAGGTALAFAGGARLARGSAPQCRFDLLGVDHSPRCAACRPILTVTLNASFAADADGSGGALRCVSPAARLTGRQMLTGLGGEIPISISLNGQQFALQPTSLKVYSVPAPALASPACGPTFGGTAVAVVGVSFPGGEESGLAMAGGSAYRCRFGAPDAPVAPLDVHGTHTTAPQGDLVHCVSPLLLANRTLAGVLPPLSSYPLFVSLNAQQYTPAAELPTFSFLDPPPLPSIVRPLEGRQNTPITIYGAGYDDGCDYRCRFGILGTVAASYDTARGAIRCAVPSPAAVGVPLELASTSLNSTAALPMAVSLNGQQFHGIKTNFSLVAG